MRSVQVRAHDKGLPSEGRPPQAAKEEEEQLQQEQQEQEGVDSLSMYFE